MVGKEVQYGAPRVRAGVTRPLRAGSLEDVVDLDLLSRQKIPRGKDKQQRAK